MKLFQKILVVILAVTMVFSTFPFAVFANDVDPEPDPREIVTPRYVDDIGTGKDGSITVTLSTRAIMDILAAIGDTDFLKEKLGEMMEMEGDLITFADIMEIVPFEAILNIIMYDEANKNGLGRLVETLGGTHAVLALVDVDRIIASATRVIDPDNPGPDDIDDEGNIRDTLANVISIISSLEGFETAIKTGAVLNLNLQINYANLYQYVDFSKIRQKFVALSFAEKQALFSDFNGFVNAVIAGLDGTLKDNNGNPLGIADLLDTTTTDPDKLAKVNGIVKELIELDTTLLADVLADVIAQGYDVPDDAYTVNITKVKEFLNANPAFKASMIQRITNPEPGKEIITEAGMAKLVELLQDEIEITAEDVEFILGDPSYLNLSAIKDAILNPETNFLTEAGMAALQALFVDQVALTAEDVEFILSDPSYLNFSAIIAALQDDDKNFLTDAGKAKLQELLNSQITITSEDVEFILSDTTYLDPSVVVDAILDPTKNFLTDAGLLALITATGFNPTPAQIEALYNEHPEYFNIDTLKSAITTAGILRLLNLEDLVNVLAEDTDGSLGYYDPDMINAAITPEGEAAFRAAFQPSLEQVISILSQDDGTLGYYDENAVRASFTTAGLMRLYQLGGMNPSRENVLEVLLEDIDGTKGYYDHDAVQDAVTPAGQAEIFNQCFNPTVLDILTIFSQDASYYDLDTLKSAITEAGRTRLMEYLDESGFNPTVEQVLEILSESSSYYDQAIVLSAISSDGKIALYETYGTLPTFAQIQTVMDTEGTYDSAKFYAVMNEAVTAAGKAALLERLLQQNRLTITAADIQTLLGDDSYYDETKLIAVMNEAITTAGKSAMVDHLLGTGGLTITAAQIMSLLSDEDNYDSEKLYALLNQAITEAGVAALAERLLQAGRLTLSDSVLQTFLNTPAYYNFTNLADAVLRALDDDGVNIALADVATVDVGKLMADAQIGAYLRSKLNEYASRFSISELMEIVDSYGGIQQFLSSDIYGYDSLIDLALTNVGGQYIYVNVSSLVDLLLGGSLTNLPAILKDGESFATILRDGTVISTSAVMSAIHDSGEPLQSFIDFNAIFDLLEGQSDKMGDLLRQVETKVLGEELGDNMTEILEALSDEQYNKLVMLSLQCGDIRIHRILLDGYEIAARSTELGSPRYGHLNFDVNAIVAALWSIIPKFEEIGADDFDGLLTAFNFRMIYEIVQNDQNGNPVIKEKDINLALKVKGDTETIRRIGKVLDRYIKLEKTNNFFELTINVPSFVTDLYRYFLEEGESELIANLRQKVLAMETMNGEEVAEALAELPISEIVAGLRDFDICELYERIFNIGKVQALLNKFQEYTNLHIDLDNISSLDRILEHFRRHDLSTIQMLLEQASERIGTDLKASLEKVARVADENEYAQKLIERARSVPFVGKFFENVTAQQVMEEYIDYNPVEAMVRYASVQLNKDFMSKFYSEQTAYEIYQNALSYAQRHLAGPYKKVCQLIGRMLDPSYQPQNATLARILSYIPDGVLSKIAKNSLLDFYRGDSVFTATRTRGSLSIDELSERILQLAERIRPLDDDLKDYALALLPTGKFYFGSHMTVNFLGGLYRTDFYKKDGSRWFTCFLPNKIDPKIILLPEVEGFEPFYWMDQPGDDGVRVTSIQQDQKLYPFYLEYFTVSYQYEGNEIGTEEVLDGYNLAAVPEDPDLPDEIHDWELRYYVDGVEIDPETYVVTEDTTITLAYTQLTDTVIWKNGDVEIYREEVAYGETPVYDVATYGTPEKAADAQYTYTFTGWTPAIDAVTGEATYQATFSSTVNEYTITWLDENGNLIDTTTVAYGTVPTHDDPEKAATAQYTYTFTGWTPEVVAVTGEATYQATFSSEVNEYTITWVDGNGTTIKTEQVAYGTIPAYTGDTPTKTATAQYTYTFTGWTPEVVAVTGEATYQATFSSEVNEYTITWVDGNGTTIKTEQVAYGTVPAYTGDTPTKTATAQYTYTFTGWTPEVVAVTGEATYQATFSSEVNEYTITWKDDQGNVIDTTTVAYGTVPTHDDPEKAATAQYTYTFTGWTPEVVAVTGEATYQATFSSEVNEYTITWKDDQGNVIDTTQVAYGTVPTHDDATKEATAQYTYTFTGWTPEVVAVTGEATYTATFSSEVNEYTITWKDDQGNVIDTTTVAYGTVPTHDDATKEATAQYTYTFTGWTPEVVAVTGEATYQATFSSEVNEYTITWKDDQGNVIDTTTVAYGTVPTHDDPEKAATAQYTYTFTGWTPEVVAVTGEATYTATFSSEVNEYTITWKDDQGNVIDTTSVAYGTVPTHDDPEKAATAQYTYTFTGWTPEVVAVTGEATYQATFSSEVNEYTITWKDDQGNVIDTTTVAYGTVPTHDDPEKAATAQYTYTFTGWTPEVVAVTGEATYQATFSSEVNEYTITWKDDQGNVIDTTSVAYGTVPTHDDATKEATAQYTYTFTGWTPEVVAVTGEATYQATFSSEVNEYTITWKDDQGNIIDTTTVAYGTVPTHDDATKEATAQYTYTFTGWTPEVVAVTGEATYTATFSSEVNEYTIIWKDDQGNIIDTTTVAYGTVPTHDDATKEATAQYTYTFTGWTPEVVAVTGEATYQATFSSTVNEYTITWLDENGNLIDTTTVAYGTVPTHDDATKEATAQYTYTFTGWTPEVVAVTGEATYTATFSSEVNEYTITWKDDQGNVIDTTTVAYGTVPTHDDATKTATAQYTYTFTGWTPEVVAVTGEATYTATFSSEVNEYTITWVDGNGTTIKTEQVAYGTVPAYTGDTPTKTATAQYTYTFTGWTPEVVAVTGEATYQATFSSTVNEYTITWLDENGNLIDTTTVAYGTVPTHDDPEKAATAQYTYTFTGWTPEVVAVTGEATYTATFSSEVNEYTITWKDDQGNVIDTTTVAYGTVPTHDDATKEATAQYTYTFTGWTPEVVAVTGEATYTATFSETRIYTVVYEYKENEIGTETVQDGDGLANIPADPELPDQDHDWELRYYVGGVEIDIETYVPEDDVTITLVYVDVTPQPTNYTVTYQYNGTTIGTEEVAANGNLANLPAAPQKPDQTHVWELRYYVSGTLINVSTYHVTSDVTITLQYVDVTPPQPTNYTVTYKYNGETIGSEIVQKNGKLANLPAAPEKPDQTHDWELRYFVNGSRINVSTYRVTNNVIVVLNYVDVTPEPTNYTVIYQYNDEEIGSEEVAANGKLANAPIPEQPDDTHIWELRYFVNDTQINVFTYRVTGDVTITLAYIDVTPQPIFYTVTYEYDGEEIGSETVQAGNGLAEIPADPELPDETHVWVLRYYVDGVQINVNTYVPTSDVTITLQYIDVTPVGKTITVYVQNEETGKYEVVHVKADDGATLEDILELLPAWTGDDTLVGGGQNYTPHVFVINREEDGEGRFDMTDAVALTERAASGVEYIALYYPDYLTAQTEDDEEVKQLFAALTTDEDGNWTLVLTDAMILDTEGTLTSVTDSENPNRFVLTLDTEAPDFADANSLTVRYGDGAMVEMTGELMETLKQEGNGKMRFSIKLVIGERVFDSADESPIPFVQAPAKEVYELELLVQVSDEDPESGVKIENFEGGMAITVKAVRVQVLDGTAGWRTNAYILEGEKALPDDLMVTVSESDGTVTFRPPHFTEIGLVNEYYLDVVFEGSTEDGDVLIGGKPVGNGGYIPEGATLQNVTPKLSEEAAKAHDIVSMYTDADDLESGNDLLMPSAPMTITVVTEAKEVVVVVNGEEIPAQIGDILPIEIPVGPDEALVELPEGGILIDVIDKEDGGKVYIFGIPVTPNPKPVTYKIEKLTKEDYYVTNGIIGEEQEGEEYKVTKDTTFYSGTYHFQLRDATAKGCSLLWLWILLIILLLIAIIAVLYRIIKKKGLGPNIFTKIIVGIVMAFFMLSLGVYSFFTGKAFKK